MIGADSVIPKEMKESLCLSNVELLTQPTTILDLTLPYPLPLLCLPSFLLFPGNISIHFTGPPSAPLLPSLLLPGNFSIHLGKGGYLTPKLIFLPIVPSISTP